MEIVESFNVWFSLLFGSLQVHDSPISYFLRIKGAYMFCEV